MYKKIVLFCMVVYGLQQYAADNNVDSYAMITPWIEIKPSYFIFSGSLMHEIYHHGGFQIQASASVPLSDYCDVYTSIGYRKAWGNALNSDENTDVMVVPNDLGIKPVVTIDEHCYYFVAFGPRFFYMHQYNDSAYINTNVHGGGIGFFINTGFDMRVTDHFVLGIFGEYSYEKENIYATTENVYSNGPVQIGGFSVGLSFGYAF